MGPGIAAVQRSRLALRVDRPGLLVRSGLLALAVAQVLPVYTYTEFAGPENQALGYQVTVSGWAAALMVGPWALVLGWLANVAAGVMLLVGLTSFRRTMIWCAAMTVVLAVIGVVALASLDEIEHVTSLESGAFAWLAGMVACAAGVSLRGRSAAGREPTYARGLVGATAALIVALAAAVRLLPLDESIELGSWLLATGIIGALAGPAVFAFVAYPVIEPRPMTDPAG
jgi:hypothetical protein